MCSSELFRYYKNPFQYPNIPSSKTKLSSHLLPCFHVVKYGRFGNNLISFFRAIQICKKEMIRRIVIEPGFIFQNSSFYYDDILVSVSNNFAHCLSFNTYYQLPQYPRLKLDEPINETFKDIFYDYFPKVNLPNNSLVIHIRSGDIFGDYQTGSNYDQPPCHFYTDVIKMKKWENVILIAENELNPCVNFIRSYCTIYHLHSFKLDLAYLLNAENLVVSQGTLWIAITFLSKKLKNLYIFDHPQTQIIDHMNCVATQQYRKIMNPWFRTPKQLQTMVQSRCDKWEFIKHQPQKENDPYVWENII